MSMKRLMQELKDIRELTEPDEIFLVVDAMTGQDAVNVANNFNETTWYYRCCSNET